MGWFYNQGGREALIRELVAPTDIGSAWAETLEYADTGSVVWSLVRVTAKRTAKRNAGGVQGLKAGERITLIRCDLINGRCNNHGQMEWGYKPLDESVHPFYYDCPLAYLDAAPVQCEEWRAKVRAYHAQAAKQATLPLAAKPKRGAPADSLGQRLGRAFS